MKLLKYYNAKTNDEKVKINMLHCPSCNRELSDAGDVVVKGGTTKCKNCS